MLPPSPGPPRPASTSGTENHALGPVIPQLDPALLDADAVARDLGVDPAVGLTSAEAADRLLADGPNELRATRVVPAWRTLLGQFRNPLVYLLVAAIGVSLLAWFWEGARGVPVDALVIAAVVVLNALIGFAQEQRAADAVAALSTMTAATSTVLRDGELRTVPAAHVVRGDVLVLSEGDAVGADARVLSAVGLTVAEAALTGESDPVLKQSLTLDRAAPLGDQVDMVFKGTAVARGVGTAAVTATGMHTEVGSIARMLDATEETVTPLQREIRRVGRALGVAVVVIAVVVMVTIVLVDGIASPEDAVAVLLLGVSLAVAAVPEGLPAILSVILAIGVQRMARRNAVVKRLDAVEALGSASIICSDKTGTLTRNEMTVTRIVTASGRCEVTGAGYRPDGAVRADGDEPAGTLRAELQHLLAAGALANRAELHERDGRWEIQGDPTEAALLVAARKLVGVEERVGRHTRQREIPFTSERKLMSIVGLDVAAGVTSIFTKGAPDVLLARCSRLQVGEDRVELTDDRRAAALHAVDELSDDALRTIGIAVRRIDEDPATDGAEEIVEADLVYLGVVGIMDPPRTEAAGAIELAHRAGIRVAMITGDHPRTAARIAGDLGLMGRDEVPVTGAELDGMDASALQAVTREAAVYARVAPEHKLRLVAALQADGHTVAMTGDGVNDAPALKAADIGIAMGISGTEVAKEAARMVLVDDDFATIVAAVHEGRIIFDNLRKALRYLLSSNMGEVLTVFLGVVLAGPLGLAAVSVHGIALPLLATQILWINLITDSAPALAMGVDPEIDDVMRRAPRRPTDRAIDGQMWRSIIGIGLVTAIVSLLAIDLCLPGGLVPGSGTIDQARTAGFTTLVLAELFNALNARSATVSAFRHLASNPLLWAAIALGALLQVAVVTVPVLQVAFTTAALSAGQWAACVGLASVVLWYEEARKAVVRMSRRPSAKVRGRAAVQGRPAPDEARSGQPGPRSRNRASTRSNSSGSSSCG